MANAHDSIVVCTYRVKAGRETEFVALLKRHWPTLMRLGLVHEQPRMALRGRDTDRTSCFVEMFAWKEGGFAVAHQHPEVLAIWEPMEQMCEARGGHPATEFPHYAILAL